MSMRKHIRAVAHYMMQADGIERINKPMPVIGADGKPTGKKVSFFSSHWRVYAGMTMNQIKKPTRKHGKRHKYFVERGAVKS